MTPTKDNIFRVSSLPAIKNSEMDAEDALLISDKSSSGKWYSKKLTVKGLTNFLSGDMTMNNMVVGNVTKEMKDGGKLKPVVENVVSSQISSAIEEVKFDILSCGGAD